MSYISPNINPVLIVCSRLQLAMVTDEIQHGITTILKHGSKLTLLSFLNQVLKFLHDKGIPYGHLHASNVLIEDDTCKLLDIENSLLGLSSYYRSYITQFRKINVSFCWYPATWGSMWLSGLRLSAHNWKVTGTNSRISRVMGL